MRYSAVVGLTLTLLTPYTPPRIGGVLTLYTGDKVPAASHPIQSPFSFALYSTVPIIHYLPMHGRNDPFSLGRGGGFLDPFFLSSSSVVLPASCLQVEFSNSGYCMRGFFKNKKFCIGMTDYSRLGC
ncbi:hypothetical protein L873DRAFT_1213544 [Choiromyces venosus 120613-1]|uniref:Uncharacterized protein n=1 Tax=Choiromyces venosus 120613-1 TaxID=1336337 RepID=A0A3N4JJ37_9PEZI|nr:hypothetical protein L873DRAFT_1213544 [Choiromyces venosus 120613-1]